VENGDSIIARIRCPHIIPSPAFRYSSFPLEIIQCAVWLYYRYTPSYRDVENLLAEREINVSCKTIRRWVIRFGAISGGNNE
jgi:transposase-like protein